MSKNYDFDDDFQQKVAALALRDSAFAESTFGLIQPEYFSNGNTGKAVAIALDYYSHYRSIPSSATYKKLLKDAVLGNKIRRDQLRDVVDAYNALLQTDISDRSYAIDQITDFARHRATEEAILKSVDLLNSGKMDEIEKLIKEALSVGSIQTGEYDFFAEIDNRAEIRKSQESGDVVGAGITTGSAEIDAHLHHSGFGRRELSIFLGSYKSGKSFALLHSAVSGVLSGHNVLFVTLENSREVTTERFDSYLSDTLSSNIKANPDDVAAKVKNRIQRGTNGKLMIHEYPTGTLRPKDLKLLLKHYYQKGLRFDMIVIDYLDLMRPDKRHDEIRENSKSIWETIRAIGQEEDAAIVSATQSNREGASAGVIDGSMVSEDINKIRIADLVISINKTEEEKRSGRCRLFFAAGRNQADGLTINIKQDLSRAKFITEVVSVD